MPTPNVPRKGYELHRAVVQSADPVTGIAQVKIPDLLGQQVVDVHWAGLEKVAGVYQTPNVGDMSLVAVSNDGTQIMWVLSADHSALWGDITDLNDLILALNTPRFSTVAVSGQSNVVADQIEDTLTLAAGSGIVLTTTAGTDTVTIAATTPANNFGTVSVSGQSDVVADATSDTLTLAAGSGVTITTNAATDTVTVANSAQNFGTVSVSGQSDVVADALSDTLTLAAGTAITITTNAATDTVTVTNAGVTSAVAGTGVSVSGATGAVTISIGQSVATTATPTFGEVTLNQSGGGAKVTLSGATSNWVEWTATGVAAPSFTTRSAGVKLLLYPGLSGSAADYAIGIASSTLWFGVPTTNTNFAWYNGTTLSLTMDGSAGQLQALSGTIGAPTYSFAGDTNTGLFRNAADDVQLISGGALGLASIAGVGYANSTSTTSATTTWRHPGLGVLAVPSSSIRRKDNITEIDGDLALTLIDRMRPAQFTWKPMPNDTEEMAALRPLELHVGFIAEWMAEMDTPIPLAEFGVDEMTLPPAPAPLAEDATEEERAAYDAIVAERVDMVTNLERWVPVYWKEPHVIALLTAAVKRLSARIALLESPPPNKEHTQ